MKHLRQESFFVEKKIHFKIIFFFKPWKWCLFHFGLIHVKRRLLSFLSLCCLVQNLYAFYFYICACHSLIKNNFNLKISVEICKSNLNGKNQGAVQSWAPKGLLEFFFNVYAHQILIILLIKLFFVTNLIDFDYVIFFHDLMNFDFWLQFSCGFE